MEPVTRDVLQSLRRCLAAPGDLLAQPYAEEKGQRILPAAERWPELPATSVAIIFRPSASTGRRVLLFHRLTLPHSSETMETAGGLPSGKWLAPQAGSKDGDSQLIV